jgi:ligand-binding SRPBCC domain-containing protein
MTTSNSIAITPDTHPKLGKVWRINATQLLPRPIDEVFPFFTDAYNLERLTPSFLGFKVLTPKPIHMQSGTVINYTLKVHHVPIRWKTTIQDWNPPHSFVDNQDKGPYTLWHHTHAFTPSEDGNSTLCEDTVLYKPKGWILAPLINKFFVQRDVRNIFQYRFTQLESIFPPQASNEPLCQDSESHKMKV